MRRLVKSSRERHLSEAGSDIGKSDVSGSSSDQPSNILKHQHVWYKTIELYVQVIWRLWTTRRKMPVLERQLHFDVRLPSLSPN
jgi:hypothetical protein